MKQSGETSKICSFSLIIIEMLIYLFIFSSTLFLVAYVNCIFVKKLIKMFLKKRFCFYFLANAFRQFAFVRTSMKEKKKNNKKTMKLNKI